MALVHGVVALDNYTLTSPGLVCQRGLPDDFLMYRVSNFGGPAAVARICACEPVVYSFNSDGTASSHIEELLTSSTVRHLVRALT
jgi:hypothetical protein